MQKGFTLLEMMIVVVIIGVLAAVAIPSYQHHVVKTKRANMMADLQSMASRIESKKMMYSSYGAIPAKDLTEVAKVVSNDSAKLYDVAISPLNAQKQLSSTQWVITATPKATGQMKGDGNLVLHANGRKCRASKCGMGDEWRD